MSLLSTLTPHHSESPSNQTRKENKQPKVRKDERKIAFIHGQLGSLHKEIPKNNQKS